MHEILLEADTGNDTTEATFSLQYKTISGVNIRCDALVCLMCPYSFTLTAQIKSLYEIIRKPNQSYHTVLQQLLQE